MNDWERTLDTSSMNYNYYVFLKQTLEYGQEETIACCQLHVSKAGAAVLRYKKFGGPAGLPPTETIKHVVEKLGL